MTNSIEKLYRPKNINDIKVTQVLIVGNGAVIDGWKPMIRAVRDSSLFEHLRHCSDDELETIVGCLPSIAVHEYNLCRNMLVSQVQYNESLAKRLLEKMALFFEFTYNLGKNYREANLAFRPEIRDIVEACPDDTGVITLNYDSSLWNLERAGRICFPNLLCIHGTASISESLYFPTDSTVLDELTSVVNLIEDLSVRRDIKEKILESLVVKTGENARMVIRRFQNLTDGYKRMHNAVIEWIENSKNLTIWGVGFNPYDAEFLSIASAASRNRKVELESLVVLNPCQDAAERARIFFNASKDVTSHGRTK